MSKRKGIILSGGKGTRLYPATLAISKQLLPVYDKPMIYYPLSTLMETGVREVLIITTGLDIDRFKMLLGDGSHLGIEIKYEVQENPNGIAEAFIVGKEFLKQDPSVLILGDNIFYGNSLPARLSKISESKNQATILACIVNNPSQYGIVNFNKDQEIISLEEKPTYPKSKYAITGLYFYDHNVVEIAKSLKPSSRGELEITDLNKVYLENNLLDLEIMGRGDAWLDAGTNDSFIQATQFIHTIEKRQGLKIACLEEIAWKKEWINDEQLEKLAKNILGSDYGKYLYNLLEIGEKNDVF